VDIYVKKQPSSAYIPLLVPPLLQLVITASPEESQLSEKATGILRSRIGKLKECPQKDESVDIGYILEDLHSKARHVSSGDILTTMGQCCCYLVRALDRTSTDGTVRLVYRQSLQDFVTRKASRLNVAFFQEFIRRCPEAAWGLKQDILNASVSEKAVNAYRKCQTLGLLNLLFNNVPTKVEGLVSCAISKLTTLCLAQHFRGPFDLYPIVTGHNPRLPYVFCYYRGAHNGTAEGRLQVSSHSNPPDKKVL
jgi:DNA polymerase phi